ncbi:MAG: hypothetical protein KGH64_04225 [Candidatus Micrarchaeota archaeon]|nr:hypothetical protein [Candidatus Micrarchaeota archaeon]MDE1834518.1 hypothetical protein [Candidatus Micrarchaeota archaeon]MDE1858928.1 hypothetical protein [Candidatus Micrarchaeota archaeon]
MFLFGSKGADKIPSAELMQLLNSIFNKRFAQLESRAAGITLQLTKEKERFAMSCDNFERLNAEPYTEDLWNPNINAINSQKAAYSTKLRNLVSEMDLSTQDALDVYSRYRDILLAVDDATEKILKANADFKIVLYCYSNHLREFKKSFSSIEQLRDTLKKELESRAADYEIYYRICSNISRLHQHTEELELLNGSISALCETSGSIDESSIGREEAEVSRKISEKAKELQAAAAQISDLSNSINMLVAPLRKASRKFDHASGRKIHITDFIEDPINTIKGKEDYDRFIDLVLDLKKYVDADSSDVKNRESTIASITALAASDMLSDINGLEGMKSRKRAIESEIRDLERIMDGLKEGRSGIASSAHEMERMHKAAEELERSRIKLKEQIEKEFLDNYSKKISIIM